MKSPNNKLVCTTYLLFLISVCIDAFSSYWKVVTVSSLRASIFAKKSSLRSPYGRLTPLREKRSFIEELSGMENEDNSSLENSRNSKNKKNDSQKKKEKIKLEPEVVFFEGGPDISEIVIPTISILTVIGIIPFAAALARQAWVRYTITSRRIKVVSGINGADETEVVYPDIKRMVYAYRFFGRCGDIVMELRDGSKLELRSMPNFEDNYNYIYGQTMGQCQEDSMKIKSSSSKTSG